MDLPHYEHLKDVPRHLITRAGLKKVGQDTPRPEPVATVTSYGKKVFLYHLHPQLPAHPPQTENDPSQDCSDSKKARVRVKTD